MADENKKAGDQDQKSKIDTAKILYDYAKEQLRIEGDFRDMLKESVRELKNTLKTYKDIESVLGTLDQSQINTKEIQIKLSKITKERYKNQLDLSELEKNTASVNKKKVSTYIKAVENLATAEKDRFNINRTTSDKELEDAIILHQQNVDNLNSQLGLLESVYAQKLATEKIDEDIAKQLEIQLSIEKKVQKTIGFAGAAAKMLGTNIQVGTEAYEAMVEAARKGYSSTRVMFIGFKKAIKEGLNDPLIGAGMIAKANNAIFSGIGTAFSFIKDIAQKVFGLITGWNDSIFEFGKNLGVGEDDARGMMNHFQDMALNSGPLFLRTSKIAAAFNSMSESLGFIAPMNDEMLQTATLLQRQFGLTATDLEAINANSALSGKSFKDTFDTINAIRMVEGGRNKVMMSQKQMMGEISKVSATVLMNFRGNVPALAEAVVRAKKLGLSLNEIQGTTDQFLDFEGSISKEFEAQLFTGEDLNLQQLRRLALAHDTKGMMEEIGKRIPTMDKWNNMNTLAQETYANAMGLTADKVSEIIQKQQIANKLGVDASLSASQMYQALKDRNLTEDQIVQKMKEAGAQQYLTAAMSEKIGTFIDNIKMTLGQMLEGELGKTINGFLSMASNSEVLHGWLKKIEGVLKGVGTFFTNLPENLRLMLSGFAKIAGIIAALEGAVGLLLLVKSYGVDPRGWALMAGAAKLGVAAYAANEGSNALGEMISVSKAAAQNEAASSTNPTPISTTPATNQNTQSILLTAHITNVSDGEVLGRQSIKFAQSAAPADNTSNHYMLPRNNSIYPH